jgi:hypothetical protein
MSMGGRMLVERAGNGVRSYSYQWPGTYFEAAFKGSRVYFKVGPGDGACNGATLTQTRPPD